MWPFKKIYNEECIFAKHIVDSLKAHPDAWTLAESKVFVRMSECLLNHKDAVKGEWGRSNIHYRHEYLYYRKVYKPTLILTHEDGKIQLIDESIENYDGWAIEKPKKVQRIYLGL